MAAPSKRWIIENYNAAQKLHSIGKLDQALKGYRAISARAPNVAEVHYQIGRILADRGQFTDARSATESALKLRPSEEAIWILLANITQAIDNTKLPAVLKRARKSGLNDQTIERIEAYIQKSTQGCSGEPAIPNSARTFLDRANDAVSAGQDTTALKFIDRALKKAPGSPALLIRRAEILMTLGDLAAANDAAEEAVSKAPHVPNYWNIWARAGKRKPNDPQIDILRDFYDKSQPGSDGRCQMGFALAKVMEDIGAYDQVFKYLNEANAITQRKYPYGHDADLKIAQTVRRTYTPELVKQWRDSGWDKATPIFITGLPRSGTTLVEQILASHSKVSGAGETSLIYRPLSDLVTRISQTGIEMGTHFSDVGKAYAKEITQRFPNVAYVTDKSIATYVLLGYVKLALPNAKIIVVRRDPRDSCVSILKTQFQTDQHRYSYSMESTAAFYKLFSNQVAFWRNQAPDAFMEVNYEDIIEDLEGQARRMLSYCALEWEDQVLDFHRNKRSVKTLSIAQVRQPLYSSSVGAWKRYEKELGPLLKSLGPIDALS